MKGVAILVAGAIGRRHIARPPLKDRSASLDVIYMPIEAAFIRATTAKDAGVMNGRVHQAVEASRLFTGAEPYLARLHRTFAAALAARDAAPADVT